MAKKATRARRTFTPQFKRDAVGGSFRAGGP